MIKVENVPELYGDHLEADTRVAFLAKHVDEANPRNIVIRANDTDIMVILLNFFNDLLMISGFVSYVYLFQLPYTHLK